MPGGDPFPVKGMTDAFLARFDSGGHPLWVVPYGNEGQESATHLAVAPSGTVVIAGSYVGPESDPWAAHDSGIFVAAFDPSGALLWDERFYFSTQYVTVIVAIAVDVAGDIVLAGGGGGEALNFGGVPLPSDSSSYLVKLDAGGHHKWSRSVGGADYPRLSQLAVDAAGNLAVSGAHNPPLDAGILWALPFVQRYDASGQLTWSQDVIVNTVRGPAIAFTPDGTLLAVGERPSPDGYDAVVAVERFDAGGLLLGEQAYGGHLSGDDVAVVVDPAGTVIVCGDYVGEVDFGQGLFTTMPHTLDVYVAKLGKP